MASSILGTTIVIDVDTGDSKEPEFGHVKAVVQEVVEFEGIPAALVVRLREAVTLTNGFSFTEILLGGQEDRFVERLLDSTRRQITIRVPVAMWRVKGSDFLERFKRTRRPPPATEYIGRGEAAIEE